MSTDIVRKEREFLIRKALFIAATQYGRKFDANKFDVRSITGKKAYPYGYEIWTNRTDDFFRCRMYLALGPEETLGRFKQELDQATITPGLGDEVLVAYGKISNASRQNRDWLGLWLNPDPWRAPYVMVDNQNLLLLDEQFALLQ